MKEIKIGRMLEVEGTLQEIQKMKDVLFLSATGGYKEFFIKLYEEVKNPKRLLIPRATITTTLKVQGDWKKISSRIKTNIELRKDQIPVVSTFMRRLVKEGRSGGILKAVTGSGKTVMGIEMLVRIGYKTFIIVPTSAIMTHWLKNLKTFSNLKRSDIGYIRQNICDIEGKLVVVAMLHTLVKDKYTKLIQKEFGTVIFDEVHVLGAETFSRVASLLDCKYRIGLSATPRRKDGMGNVFFYHIGRVLSQYKKIDVKPKIVVVSYKGVGSNHIGCYWKGKLSLGKYYNRIVALKDRNYLIAKYIKASYDKNRHTLVLTERLNHIKVLIGIASAMGVPASEMGECTASKKQLNKKIIIGTYGSASLGLDIPVLSCLILAVPRVDVEQPIGRIMRKKEEKKIPIVIDIVDIASNIMVAWSLKRIKYYKKEGFQIKYKG